MSTLSGDELKRAGDEATYIHRLPLVITTSILLAFALLFTALHFFFRLYRNRTLHLDDTILAFSILCLITGSAILHSFLSDIYLSTAMSAKPSLSLPQTQVADIVNRSHGGIQAFQCLMWTTLFGAKIAFLTFFKQFVEATRSTKTCWSVALVATVAGWGYMFALPFALCPHKAEATQCVGSGKESAVRILAYFGTAADCLTSVILLAFPITMLQRLHTTLRQKTVAATLVCLTLVTVVVAILRGALLRNPQNTAYDIPLHTFLTYSEACIAVVLVSVTAFPSNFHRTQYRNASEERLNTVSPCTYGHAIAGPKTYVRGGSPDSGGNSCGIARKESVLRTREVVVEVHYERDLEKKDWERITSPRWVDEKWERRSGSSQRAR